MKLTNTRITTLLLMLSAVVLLALSACSSDGNDGSDGSKNTAPVADAGIEQHPKTGSLVTLDGAGSSDADHDQLFYDWSIKSKPAGSNATLSDTSSSHPTFTADMDGDYVIELTVNDGTLDSTNDEAVTVTATHVNANAKPVAVATVDKPDPKTGELVKLDGSGSNDADGDSLTYLWTITAWPFGSTAQISDVHAETTTFTPDLDGDYTIELIVNDGHEDSDAATVRLTATHDDNNAKPVAHAGDDQDVNVSDVTLDGRNSHDTDSGDTLTYSWTIQSRPNTGSTATLAGATTSQPTFTPDVWGDYVFKLIVNDGHVDSDPDTVSVHATPNCGADSACVFVTSQSYNGDLQTAGPGVSGYLGADKVCNKEANDAGMPGTYMAWISTDAVDGRDNPIRDRLHPNSNEPYRLPSGVKVANTWSDLVDGTLDHSINGHIMGRLAIDGKRVWTGTYADGGSAGLDCGNFADGTDEQHGLAGSTDATDSSWSNVHDSTPGCASELRLYCFQYKQP